VFFQTPQARFPVALHFGIFLGKHIGDLFSRILFLALIGIRNAVIFKGDLARRLVLSGKGEQVGHACPEVGGLPFEHFVRRLAAARMASGHGGSFLLHVWPDWPEPSGIPWSALEEQSARQAPWRSALSL
jgi:hypothetical protein